MKQRIALVDDDKNILTSVTMALEAAGFAVSAYSDGATALRGLMETPADLAVLDIKMPRMDGIELLKRIRERSSMPVMFLTSKDDEADQLAGLRHGADDYVTKPFSQKLLLERIRTILRRQELLQQPSENQPPQVCMLGNLTLDEGRHLCLWKKRPVDMTVTEFLLVRALTEHPGHVKSREQLMSAAYGETLDADDRTIDSHIKRIRAKFRAADPSFNAIETVYGAGYRYNHD
ncbi:MAG: response regulator transcription factor [Alphaproteobacteria bacterium]|nr:response regulator transcription factor [Alphaproteobacteria bacterium]MDE2336061.1 response regulator transcription factor [Alphaproteobacteria bacterium]